MRRLDALTGYAGRIEPDSANYTGGTFRDKSSSSSNDGTPVADAERLKDWHGAFLAIIKKANRTLSGTAETELNSDVAKAIFEDQALSNSALANDISLGKISQGTLSVKTGADTVTLDSQKISVGDSANSVESKLSKYGLRFYGANQPGDVFPYVKHAVFDISTEMAAANGTKADLNTATADSHYHRVGYTYSFATPKSTGIPSVMDIYGFVLSGGSTVGSGSISMLSPKVFLDVSSGVYRISKVEITINSGSFDLNFSSDVWLTIFYNGDYL